MRRSGVIGRRAPALAAALAAAAAALLAPAAPAQSLAERLDRALAAPGISPARTAAVAVDLESGRLVYKLHRKRPLEPASNQKLLVAVAALDRLGPSYRIRTEVRGDGSLSGDVWRGRLVLKGFGDPTLSTADIRRLVATLRAKGIRRVTGRVIGDESYFDKRRVASGWRASWYKIESPPLSALVVDRAKVNGRTQDDPAYQAARAFRRALRAAGIPVGGKATVGTAPAGTTRLTLVRSKPVSELVRAMNKVSDNFTAEQLVKHLGAKIRGVGSTAAGCRVLRSVLRTRGVPLDGLRLADGSGLSLLGRLTARSLGALLVSAWNDAAIRPFLLASLPVAGLDGTLRDRMRSGPAYRRVRAKTGTTTGASTLAGYVRNRFAFAVLQNGSPVPWTAARRAQDRFAQALARAAL